MWEMGHLALALAGIRGAIQICTAVHLLWGPFRPLLRGQTTYAT